MEVRRCKYDLRKYSFSNRITNIWNSLPDSVVMADTVNQFKNRLDKHWAKRAFLYDYLVNYNVQVQVVYLTSLQMEPEACLLYRKRVKI